METIKEALDELSSNESSEYNYDVYLTINVPYNCDGDTFSFYDDYIDSFATMEEANAYIESKEFGQKVEEAMKGLDDDGEWDDYDNVFRTYREMCDEFGYQTIVRIEEANRGKVLSKFEY